MIDVIDVIDAVGPKDRFWSLTAILMTAILLGGLILRQRIGLADIGAESLALLLVYAGAIALQVLIGVGGG